MQAENETGDVVTPPSRVRTLNELLKDCIFAQATRLPDGGYHVDAYVLQDGTTYCPDPSLLRRTPGSPPYEGRTVSPDTDTEF